MKLLLVLFLLLAECSNSQGLKIQLSRDTADIENIYKLKIYNDTSVFIGIKCSASFRYFTEDSILTIAMANWAMVNDKNSFYGIDCSAVDAQYSDTYSYQLIVIAPQTYFITKINILDHKKYDMARFRVLYKPMESEKELLLYSRRQPGKVLMSSAQIPFREKIIEVGN